MPTLFIVPFDIIIKIQEQRTLEKFVERGVTKLEIWWNSGSLLSLINSFRMGAIELPTFKMHCEQLFPALQTMSLLEFEGCWNEMYDCKVARQRISEIQALMTDGDLIRIIGEIDQQQFNVINTGLSAWQLPTIPADFLSFHAKKPFEQLLKEAIAYGHNQQMEISYILEPPPEDPYTWLGPFRRALFPLHSWCYERLAAQHDTFMRVSSQNGRLTVIPSKPNEPLLKQNGYQEDPARGVQYSYDQSRAASPSEAMSSAHFDRTPRFNRGPIGRSPF